MTGGYSTVLQASITSQVISLNGRCNIALGFESGKAYACGRRLRTDERSCEVGAAQFFLTSTTKKVAFL
jgi:hypothetical protein